LSVAGTAAAVAPKIDECASHEDLLGLSRVVEVDTASGPLFGRTPASEFDFLEDGEVILTFDDGPKRPHTEAVLNALDEQCTKGTFFMVGRLAVSDPEMVREVARRGHTVAAHTWSHARLPSITLDKSKDEIELGFSAVARAMGAPIAPFFRFPYLRPTPETNAYLKSRHIASFGIDIDSRDFKTRNGAAVKATVLAQLEKRRKGILLFHDIQPSTSHALKSILAELKVRGFKVVHMLPKDSATTLTEYDTLADREIAHRKLAVEKQPLAARSAVWQTEAGDSDSEGLPWSEPAPAPQPTRTNITRNRAATPWYKQWLLP
jgi:peptidoglycan/xylan/chitin deacetylase (PgdA/CDA1 family)